MRENDHNCLACCAMLDAQLHLGFSCSALPALCTALQGQMFSSQLMIMQVEMPVDMRSRKLQPLALPPRQSSLQRLKEVVTLPTGVQGRGGSQHPGRNEAGPPERAPMCFFCHGACEEAGGERARAREQHPEQPRGGALNLDIDPNPEHGAGEEAGGQRARAREQHPEQPRGGAAPARHHAAGQGDHVRHAGAPLMSS